MSTTTAKTPSCALAPTFEQQAIIDAAKSPASLMVNALAGTGKTTTLTMLAKALPPRPALALAFNKKIRDELEKRFPSNFSVMTMNGLGHRAWASTLNKRLVIDEKKVTRITTELLRSFPDSKSAWAQIRAAVVHAQAKGIVPSQFQHAKGFLPDTPASWQSINEEYDLGLTTQELSLARKALALSIEEGLKGTITFDDQVYLPVVFSGNFPRFEIVLVDEAQDLSPLNHAMLRKVCAGRLIVVGDPRQAIYAFRGADSASMANIKNLRKDWIELPLNTTFRCPKSVVARQWEHAPAYVAAPSNPDGEVIDLQGQPWNAADLAHGAILCRNNAPLISTAFKLIKSGIGVNMLGRDIGRGLGRLCLKISGDRSTPVTQFRQLLFAWKDREFSKAEANEDHSKMEAIVDKFECIEAVIEGKDPRTLHDLLSTLDSLFSADSGLVTLATGHKAKGLEWHKVVHLDPWRIPSRFAKLPHEIEQEANLRYVIETRTKHTLILANAKDLEV